jgi:hypothetical protein
VISAAARGIIIDLAEDVLGVWIGTPLPPAAMPRGLRKSLKLKRL